MIKPKIRDRHGPVRPAGAGKSAWLTVLDRGARVLQRATPLRGFHVYVAGFHCVKNQPGDQMEAHHYCHVVNDDLLQCVLFDGNTAQANLIGIEYIVSERLFDSLPEPERQYWHPHNYEVLSGQLVAPGLPDAVEKALMRRLLNSYGKTWHSWHTGRHDGEPGTMLPLGDPALMWSFNRDGECQESLKRSRDEAMDLDVDKKRRERRSFLRAARPQYGVDAMAGEFPGSRPIPGVIDVADSQGLDARR